MIYGVTIFLNDVNFSKKKHEDKVVSVLTHHGFFTTKKAAASFYNWHKNQWLNELAYAMPGYERRGRCEMYKANVMSGQILDHGITIYSETPKAY